MPDPTQNPDSGEHPDPWETHAAWWQEQFTDGVDPEYTEQILPLIAAHLPEGADRVTGLAIDVGCGEGQVARVLRPGGRFLFLLNHPLLQTPGSGWIDDQVLDPPEQYWRIGPYLREAETIEEVEKDVFIRFFHRPLSRYLNAAYDAGLVLERMEEPAPPPGFLARAEEYADAASVPRLLLLRFTRT